MRTPLVLAIAALLGLSSAFLVACGDRNNLLPRSNADALRSDIASARDNYAGQECRAAEGNLAAAQDKVTELPSDVDRDLRENLRTSFEKVRAEVQTQCGAERTDTTPTTETTETTETETVPTETTPTEPETDTSEPETETTPPDGGEDSGGTPAEPGKGRGRGQGKD